MNEWYNSDGSKHWPGETRSYGKNAYVMGLLHLIEQQNPAAVFELGLGDGYPFAVHLQQQGIAVSGCDISLFLLKKLEQENPDITWFHAGYDTILQLIHKQRYDVVYCLRSSWYFEDFFAALQVMITLTKPGGALVFDVMNKNATEIRSFLRGIRIKKYRQITKIFAKRILNRVFKMNYTYDTNALTPHFPLHPPEIDTFLQQQGLTFEKYSFDQITGETKTYDPRSFRVIYRVAVPKNF